MRENLVAWIADISALLMTIGYTRVPSRFLGLPQITMGCQYGWQRQL
jgi:hypothetical protein